MAEPFDAASWSILDEDIAWAALALGLPPTAFSGADGNDPRLAILKNLGSLDIEACPGSGKTTLLVAKLAILARHWTLPSAGLCVLSHTNVARREIELKLAGTAAGQHLLGYPHYVGTIHGFVNTYLAIPWLRSLGYPVRFIDDDVALTRRWKKLPYNTRCGLERNKHTPQSLRVIHRDFGVGRVRWGKQGELGRDTQTYKDMQRVCGEAVQDGFHCHDEMFVWARDLLTKSPGVAQSLRRRFPLLFLDEVQDNSEAQSVLLHQIFVAGDAPVMRQRYGDSNQAIFHRVQDDEAALTDPFPSAQALARIPNSHRFGQQIADLADPLALVPHALKGQGPSRRCIATDTDGKHAIFLFSDDSVGFVVKSYASYLQETFTADELAAGDFTVVAAVHRMKDGATKIPHAIGHYWPDYDPELTAFEPRPRTFLQYIFVGRRRMQGSGEAHGLVEMTAEAVLQLARIADPLQSPQRRGKPHRQILAKLAENSKAAAQYHQLIARLCGEGALPNQEDWIATWSAKAVLVVQAILGHTIAGSECDQFLAWKVDDQGADGRPKQRDNVYKHPADNPQVRLRVGSIHSMKGETHTATLVLESFYKSYNLTVLKPWLLGQDRDKTKESATNKSRLKQHYVAMTRPSHLLCLAMRLDTFSKAELTTLVQRGWRIAQVTTDATTWLAQA